MTVSGARSALACTLSPARASAHLIEVVAGRARLVASGEAPVAGMGPGADTSTSLRAAFSQIEAVIGRSLFALGGPIVPRIDDGSGVDAVALSVDVRPVARLVSLGDRDGSASAARALAQLDARVGDTIDLRTTTTARDLAEKLRGTDDGVDAVVISGPADAAALGRLAEALALAWPLGGPGAPSVIWCGETAGAEVARAALGGRLDFRVAAPVRPRPETEHPGPTRDAVAAVWRDHLDARLPGSDLVARWASKPVTGRRRAEEVALRYLAETRREPVWLAVWDAEGGRVLVAEPGRPDCASGVAVAADLGRRARPWVMPDLEHAGAATDLLRTAVGQLPSDLRPSARRGTALVIAGGDLTLLGAEAAVRVVIEGLGPAGAVQIVGDEMGGLEALGALAEVAPHLAAGVLDHDIFRPLCGLLAPGWRGRPGQALFRFRADTRTDDCLVGVDETRRLALAEGESVRVSADRPHWWDPRRLFARGPRATLVGGPVGLILDGRPRPTAAALSLGRDPVADDGAAPRALGEVVTVRPVVDGPAAIRRSQRVPFDARLLVGPGDTVGPTDLVAQGRAGGLALPHEIVPAGRMLGAADPRPYLVKPAGAKVKAGEVIARRRMFFGLLTRTVLAPADGVLAPGLGGAGNLAVIADPDGNGITAELPGAVVAALQGSVTIETMGSLVTAVVGFGPSAHGPLTGALPRLEAGGEGRPTRLRGAIVALDVLDRGQLDLARAHGVAGLVVGSIESDLAAELVITPPDIAIVATEGIGRAPLCAPARGLLAARQGGLACLLPAAPGNHRASPEVILPIAGAPRSRPPVEPTLAAGSRARLVTGTPTMVRVVGLPTAPRPSPTGIPTRVVEVESESGERRLAPLASLELV